MNRKPGTKRMTAGMWPEVFARSRWRVVGVSSEFPTETGGRTMDMVSEEWAKCPECGYVPIGGACPYCRRAAAPVARLEFVPDKA
jgi:hypothetical protein